MKDGKDERRSIEGKSMGDEEDVMELKLRRDGLSMDRFRIGNEGRLKEFEKKEGDKERGEEESVLFCKLNIFKRKREL